MPATDILGKIGEKVGIEFSDLKVSLGNIYATQSALSTLQASVTTNTSSISSNATGISNNASAISTNSSNISANTSSIQGNDADITALQTKTSALATNGTSATFSGSLNAQNLTLAGNLTVNGTTTTLNTQTVEIEDNIIEVNLAHTTGNETAQTGGLQVNRGSGNDKAQVIWDDTNDLFSLKKGTADAKLNVGDVDAEKVIVPSGSAILINQVSLGNYASFETEFNANK
jgi:hypothetical protein